MSTDFERLLWKMLQEIIRILFVTSQNESITTSAIIKMRLPIIPLTIKQNKDSLPSEVVDFLVSDSENQSKNSDIFQKFKGILFSL